MSHLLWPTLSLAFWGFGLRAPFLGCFSDGSLFCGFLVPFGVCLVVVFWGVFFVWGVPFVFLGPWFFGSFSGLVPVWWRSLWVCSLPSEFLFVFVFHAYFAEYGFGEKTIISKMQKTDATE